MPASSPSSAEFSNGPHASRRGFLKSGGALIISFALPSFSTAAHAEFATIAPQQLDSWLAIGSDGNVTAYTGRVDIGTGVETVFTQAIAEELDVAFDKVKFVLGDTARTPEQGKSTASNAVSYNVPPLRQAAAEARLTLLQLASKQLDVDPKDLVTAGGIVQVASDPSRRISYGQLIGDKRFNVTLGVKGEGNKLGLTGHAKVKDPSQFKLLGKPIPRVDIPAKVYGTFSFVQDITVEGMLHGTVILPPAVGAKLLSVDGFPRSIPGIVKIVRENDFLGIVAETEEASVQARNEVKATWSLSATRDLADLYRVIEEAPLEKQVVEGKTGDADAAIAGAATVLEHTYFLPYHSHGMMGPSCAVADWRDDGLTIWSGTQWPDGTRTDVATMLGIPRDKVRLVWVEAAGSYGRLGCDDAAADAAYLSRAVGRPVRVQWQRRDEFQWGPLLPGALIKIRAGLDRAGKIAGWTIENLTTSHSIAERGNMLAWRSLGTFPNYDRLSGGADVPSYAFANMRAVSMYKKEIVRGIYMRSVANIQNTFAIESMMDELAAKAGRDPIEFRLDHIANPRMKAVLQAVARAAGWKPAPSQRLSANSQVLTARGVALFGQGLNTAYIATIAEVEVDRRTGSVYVPRVYVAMDAGRIANPDGLRNQIEGGTIMGLSRGLKEAITFEGGSVTTSDWASYPVLRFTEAPESIDITLIDNSNTSMGAGEAPNVTPAAAVANAIAHATGQRIRELPLTPERIKNILGA
jgi:CO/xanthine dehydrogenase Mo-binding subunit